MQRWVVWALFVSCLAAPGAEWHVASDGNDANPGTAAKPVATIARAVELSRASTAAAKRIIIGAGTYRLAETITLGPADSGLEIVAAKGTHPLVSGGREVTGWKPWQGTTLQADISGLNLPDGNFLELYRNDHRQPLARVPNLDPKHPRVGGLLYNAGIAEPGSKTKLMYKAGELDPTRWTHVERAIMVFWPATNYENVWAKLLKVDPDKRVLEVTHGVYACRVDDRYYLCNLLEELDAPGEWYCDPEAKVLYYQPPAGQSPEAVTVPALKSLFLLQGDPANGKYVENVKLTGLDLRECRAEAVKMTGVKGCQVLGCDIRNIGVGVYLGDETHGCRVAGCDITQTLGDGVAIVGTASKHERVSDHVVDNNYIWDLGYGDYHNRTAGVWMWGCARCKATHNTVHDGPRYALGMDVGNDCEMAWNYGHHVNLETADTGIIEAATAYIWRLPQDEEFEHNEKYNAGNSIHHNLLHDSGGYGQGPNGWRYGHYSWGIYLDTACSHWRIYDNVVWNTVLGGFMLNCGQQNVVENNVFADGREAQIQFNPWKGYEIKANRCERNIFSYLGSPARLYRLNRFEPGSVSFDRNLISLPEGKPVIDGLQGVPRKASWEGWLKLGEDEHSVLGDPGFVDAANHDYRLKPDSAALKLGIKSLDLHEAGVYQSPERRTWPRPEEPVIREDANYEPVVESIHQPELRTYEDYTVGENERKANVGVTAGVSSVGVTAETAASGQKSLKVVDGPGQKAGFMPYITYMMDVELGTWHGGLDLRWETGADFVYEWRDDPYNYSLGPRITVAPDGTLRANAQVLGQFPASQWVRFDWEYTLGEHATGKYDLTMTVKGEQPQVFRDVACAPEFEYLSCAVIMANGDKAGTFYLDNVELRRVK